MGEVRLWKEEYRIGNEKIDAQHRELFDRIESLLRIARDGNEEANRKSCMETVDFLVSYTVHHFEAEEEYQRETGYISYAEHAKLHEQFKNTVLIYREKIEKDFSREILKKFAGTLMTWLVVHVCGCDRQIPKNQPLDASITFEGADDLIRKVVVQFLADVCGIGVKSARASVYGGDIQGRVIVRNIVSGERKHVFLYGLSEELARALYRRISGAEIKAMDRMDDIERSALIELGDILSSHAMAFISDDSCSGFDWRGNLFMDTYGDPGIDISKSVKLDFETDCGSLEIIYCLIAG